MKYLLSWIVDHLTISSWRELGTIEEIIKKLGKHITEIASYKKIPIINNSIELATIIDKNEDFCLGKYNNNEKTIHLPYRKDVQIGMIYLIIKENSKYQFASMKDFFSEEKSHLIPGIHGTIEDNLIIIKKLKKMDDYIIKIDNTSIGNRPDLFSHKGIAREFSLIFNVPLQEVAETLFPISRITSSNKEKKIFDNFSDNVLGTTASTLSCKEKKSFLSYISKLCPLDITPHSYLIDLTNYVMLDIGQPLHVFDKKKIDGLIAFAENKESELLCLDNTTIKTKKSDIILEDKNKAISLVGIIGGKETGVSLKTKEIILQGDALNSNSIYKSSRDHKKKTESSIRNERGGSFKSTEVGVLRYLKLLEKDGIKFTIHFFQTFEKMNKKDEILCNLLYIQKIIGNKIETSTIKKILSCLGFSINESKQDTNIIRVACPWWRQDIQTEEDISEEIVRHIGFDSLKLYSTQTTYKKYNKKNLIHDLKKHTSIIAHATEIISYGIFDEESKERWSYNFLFEEIPLINPYTENNRFLSSSMLPSMLDNILKKIKKGEKKIRLFEISPLWKKEANSFIEELFFTIIFYSQETQYDFFYYSSIIKNIFSSINHNLEFLPASKSDKKNNRHNLFSDIKGAISFQGNLVGTLGFIDPVKIFKETQKNGEVFAVEINLSTLLKQKNKNSFKARSYPFFDISCLISKNTKGLALIEQIKVAFGQIMHIDIIDWFENNTWEEKRSITIRIYTMNKECSLIKKEIEEYLQAQDILIR